MEKKRKPHTIMSIAKDVFEMKGLDYTENPELLSQFQIDFMLSGNFVCCGEDKDGEKLWDLKSRQSSSLLDKDGSYLDDPYNDNDDVIKNELKDDMEYGDIDEDQDENIDDDDDDEDEETDEIEEELLASSPYDIDEDEDEEDKFDDEDE